MSWGERSCENYGHCTFAEMHTCNVECNQYRFDGITKPDSYPATERIQMRRDAKKCDHDYPHENGICNNCGQLTKGN